MAVGPRAVLRGALGGGQARAARGEPLGEDVGPDDPAARTGRLEHLPRVLEVLRALRRARGGLGPLRLVVLAEQLRRLVEERHVRGGPRRTLGPLEQPPVLGRELGRGLGEPVRLGPQVLDEALGRERQPGQVERDAHVAVGAQVLQRERAVLADERLAELAPVLLDEAREHLADERDPREVVRLVGAPRLRDGVAHVAAADDEVVAVEPDRHVGRGHALACAHGPAHRTGHDRPTLDARDARVLLAVGDDAGQEVGDGRAHDAGLAERRQHLVDVAQEREAGADEQHARALQQPPVRVQQVGRAVQRDRRLPRAGPALDDERPRELGADDRVLLRLDRGDDVAHASCAARGHRGEQRALARERRAGHGLRGVEVEELVLEPRHGTTARHEVPTAHDAVRVGRCRAVERLGGGRAPVREEARVLFVGEADAPDVAQGAVVEVEAAEREAVLDRVELRDTVLVQRRERVALAAVLRRARRAGPSDLVEACPGGRPQLVEARVEGVHDLLLEPELVVASHAVPSSTGAAPPARPSIMAYDGRPGDRRPARPGAVTGPDARLRLGSWPMATRGERAS